NVLLLFIEVLPFWTVLEDGPSCGAAGPVFATKCIGHAGQATAVLAAHCAPFGVATSSTPFPVVSVAQKKTCPRSLLIAPEEGFWTGGGGKPRIAVAMCRIVPT